MTGAFAGTLMNTSADLVTRVCQGDADAFRLIFERYSRPVISFIYDMVNDRALAEELTQETFVRAFRAIHTMRAETKLSTWLFGIARNVARESLRARARANNHVDLADKSVMDLSDDKPVPVDGLLSKELNDLIRRSLAALDGLPIDLYLLHAPDPRVPWRTSVRALGRLVEEGLVARVGVCNVNRTQLDEACEHAPIAAVQVALSRLDDTAVRADDPM